MASSASTFTNSADPTSPLILVNLSNCIKLTALTYLPWASQLESLLFGLDLLKFIDGSHPTSTEQVTTDGKTTANPAHLTWLRQDRLLRGALLGTLDTTIAPLVLQTKTIKELWDILKTTYANPSRGHILQVKDNLDSLTKGNLSVTEYMNTLKTCTDKLAILGKPMDVEDIISKALKGLDYETYKPVIDTVRARDTTITFEALHEKLIQHELTLKQNPTTTPLPITAHYTTTSRPNPTAHSAPPTRFHHNNNPPLLPTPSSPNPSKPFQGKCQYCRIPGHVISVCRSFKRDYPNVSFPSSGNQPRRPRQSNPQPQANTASGPFHQPAQS